MECLQFLIPDNICLSQGKYCPTTCGVADYLRNYKPEMDRDLDDMDNILSEIANLTKQAEDKVVWMKDDATQAQKSLSPGNQQLPFMGYFTVSPS